MNAALYMAEALVEVLGYCNIAAKSNTTPIKGGLMNPLKGGKFDIHFHRRVAEHAEDLFYLFAFR